MPPRPRANPRQDAEPAPAPAPSERAVASLRKLSVPKASDVLADKLRRQIFTGELAEGSPLPRERALAEATQLSRGSVRDALRALEVEGLVYTRPGRAGGTFVRRPDASTFERNLTILVGGQGVRFSTVVEAREAVEPGAAALAAEHRTDDDLARLGDITTRMEQALGQPHVFQRLNVEWHVAVVSATHNEIMRAYLVSLWRAIGRATYVVDLHEPGVLEDTLRAHHAILTAIGKGDAKRAFTAMSKHAHAYRDEVLGHELADEVLPPEDAL